jgi:hypothetical protein
MKSRSALVLLAAICLHVPLSIATASAGYTPLPAHVYAPYYYLAPNTPSIIATSQASGVKYFTLAFLEARDKGSCSLDWNGNSARPLDYYNSDIAALRALGGDVIPSFGGARADSDGREIADSCTSVSQTAADYEQVITTLGVTRLDMDVEASSLTDSAGISRRNQAIAMTEAWAKTNGIPLQIQYTLPVEQFGLRPSGESVLKSAVANHAAVTSVNIMAFDYYIPGEGVVNMGQAAINAATATHTQLARIYPPLTSAQIWHSEAITLCPGTDGYPKGTEVTRLKDARAVLRFATAKGLNVLTIWAIERDNGGCPGSLGPSNCSGITQNTWAFSHLLEPFTH